MNLNKNVRFVRSYATVLNAETLLDKFKGCLVGSLLGDCLSAPYKGGDEISKMQLQKYYDQLDGPYFKCPHKSYSCVTTLTHSLSTSIVTNKGYNSEKVAKAYVKDFYDDPNRDYSENLITVFTLLRGNKFNDLYGPAKNRYLGLGSFGNTAASISAPLALLNFKNLENMQSTIVENASLINANKLGKDGASLQGMSIALSLQSADISTYLEELNENLTLIKPEEEEINYKDARKLVEQMELVNKLLLKRNISEEEVVNTLGHTKLTVFSVPTAIYCFIRSANPIEGINTNNPVRRCLQYATSLGGHTTSIASMAGAIAGAYYGYEIISQSLQRHCEGVSKATTLAEELFSVVSNNK